MDGLILIHKPKNLTSHDVVLKIRNILKIKKVGHFGTLDPLATGLMLIAIGKATKFFPFFSKTDKVYIGQIRLGFPTDTYDSLGKPIAPEINEYPDEKKLLHLLEKLEGTIHQVPPPFSAKKYKGKPLYVFARRNQAIKLKPSQVFIHYFQLKKYNPPFIDFEVKCSSGTYIRSLAHDLGQHIGCGAHLSQLMRTEVGDFNVKDSFHIDEIKKLTQEEMNTKFLIPLEILLPEHPKIILKEDGSALAKNGNMIYPDNISDVYHNESSLLDIGEADDSTYRMFSPEGKLLALAKKVPEKKCFHPFLVIDPKDIAN